VGDSQFQTLTGDGDVTLQTSLGRLPIRVRKAGYRQWEESREFVPDRGEVLDIGDIKLQSLDGTVSFKVVPADARLRVTSADGREIPFSGKSGSLREGKYSVTGSATDYDPATVPFDVVAERNRDVDVVLKRKVETPKTVTVTAGPMDGWRKEDWKPSVGGWFETDLSTVLHRQSGKGTFTFTAAPKGKLFGGKRFSVLVAYRGDKDYLEFNVQRDKVTLIEVQGGKRKPEQVKAHRVPFAEAVRVLVKISESQVTIGLANGADYTPVYEYTSPEGKLPQGRLGLKDVQRIAYFEASGQ
jgi:hypothetical protein